MKKTDPIRTKGEAESLEAAPLRTILEKLQIPNDWDVLLIGDGSGCGWNMGCGWCVHVIDHWSNHRETMCGAMTAGTITIAELFPYLHGLLWYHQHTGKHRIHERRAIIKAHCISDSELIVNQGNDPQRRKANKHLWGSIDSIIRDGYTITWHWIHRDAIGLNIAADHLSRLARLSMADVNFASAVEGNKVTIYNINP